MNPTCYAPGQVWDLNNRARFKVIKVFEGNLLNVCWLIDPLNENGRMQTRYFLTIESLVRNGYKLISEDKKIKRNLPDWW